MSLSFSGRHLQICQELGRDLLSHHVELAVGVSEDVVAVARGEERRAQGPMGKVLLAVRSSG
jgi:hypothetical protein